MCMNSGVKMGVRRTLISGLSNGVDGEALAQDLGEGSRWNTVAWAILFHLPCQKRKTWCHDAKSTTLAQVLT